MGGAGGCLKGKARDEREGGRDKGEMVNDWVCGRRGRGYSV